MEINVKERSNNSILLQFKGLYIGFLTLLVSELVNDKRVLNAYSRKPHLLLDETELYVLCKDGFNPIEVIQSKIEEIKERFSKLRKEVESSIDEKVTKAGS